MRFWVLQAIFCALFIAGWIHGAVADIFLQDPTHITALIAVVFLVGVWFAAERRYARVEYVATVLPTLGLLGTVIGFSMALIGVQGQDVVIRDLGVHAALNTTIAGLVGSLWLGLLMVVE